MINDPAMVVAIFSCIMIVMFYYYGESCGRRDAEKELKDQYLAVIKNMARENEILSKELNELCKKYDVELDTRIKMLMRSRLEKKNGD